MKTFLILLGMAAAGVLGYMAEPALRDRITESAPIARKAPTPVTPKSTPAIDPASLTTEQLPKTVILNATAKFSDPAAGIALSVAAGSHVKLLRIQGVNAIVSAGKTDYPISIPISQTDLLEQLSAQPPKAPVAPPKTTPAPKPAAAPAASPKPAAAQKTVPAPAAVPATKAAPAPAPKPAPAATATPKTNPASAPAAPGATDVVKVMQESIRGGQIKEFRFDQVLSWKAEADETVDGVVFQTGTVSYKAETIFGVKTIQAKALVKDGKVQRWIWPKSGMQIK
jgi:hypothetical protein